MISAWWLVPAVGISGGVGLALGLWIMGEIEEEIVKELNIWRE